MNRTTSCSWAALAVAAAASGALSLTRLAPAAHAAGDDAKSMADVEVTLGETLRASIDAGETTLTDIQKDGLSFNFKVNHLPGKDPTGYCNTDGQGNVQEVTKF
jgi:hypothetical protein